MTWQQRDMGAGIVAANGLDPNIVVAGSGADGVAQNGNIIDRLDTALFGDPARIFLSAKIVIVVTAVLAATETATIELKAQDGSDSGLSDAADYGTAPADLVLTGGAGGSTERAVLEMDLELGAAKQYVRAVVTPTLSAGATDTAAIAVAWAFGGGDELPVS